MKHFLKSLVVSVLTWEAKLLLSRTKPKIIAITGSVGKTSTKDAIFEAIKGKVRARKSEKSQNSEIGVPLSVLGLHNAWSNPFLWAKNIFDGFLLALFPGRYPDVLVLEMGVDHPGDMKRLTAWIKPDVVVLTRLPDVPVHVEAFDSPEAVTAEKLELLNALKTDGVLVFNNDDEQVRDTAATVRQQAIGYSRYSPAQFHAEADEVIYKNSFPSGLRFRVEHINDSAEFQLDGAIGVQHCYNFAAASAVASIFDVSLKEVAGALKGFVPPPGRMRVIRGLKDTVIIDDTYNSSPTAAERALSSLYELQGFKRKIAVLGDMLELGQFSTSAHERVGEQVADGADVLVTVGIRARGIAEGALEHGFNEAHVFQYDDSVTAGRELQTFIQPGDVLLIKGSQSIRCERIVLDIMAEPQKSAELLVRQDSAWQSIV